MERSIRIGIALLAISLAINAALIIKVNRINDMMNMRLDSINSAMNALGSSNRQSADRINQAMNIIETEQRWVTPVEIAGIKQEGGNTAILLSWIIKDYPGSAPVTFHYRKQGEKEFISQQATSMGNGRFEVELTEELETEPNWKTGVHYIGGGNGDSKTNIVAEEASREPQSMEYYITVKDGSRLKSSEIASLNMGSISEGIYTSLASEVTIDQARKIYGVDLREFKSSPGQVRLDRAYLEAYSGDKQVGQTQLFENEGKPDGSFRNFRAEYDYSRTTSDHVFLRVEYENGEKFKTEIR